MEVKRFIFMNADGRGQKNLTSNLAYDSFPSVLPFFAFYGKGEEQIIGVEYLSRQKPSSSKKSPSTKLDVMT